MDKKNEKVQYGLLIDTFMKLESNLTKQRALKRELLKDHSQEVNISKSELKKGLKRYKDRLAGRPPKKKKDVGDDSSSSDKEVVEEVTSSQEEFYDELIEIENNIIQT